MKKEKIDRLLFDFLETSYLFEKSEEKLFNLSWQEIYLLQILRKNENLIISEISQKMMLEKYQTSRLIEKMLKKGIITKTQDKSDARVFHISINQNGQLSIERVEEYHYFLFKHKEDFIAENELNIIEKLIHKFAQAVKISK